MFPDLSSAAAHEQLDPHADRFVAAIKEGVRLFNTIDPPLLYRLVRWKRVKANSLWGFIAHEIEEMFRDVPGVQVEERHGSIEIEVGDNLIARIKKMSPKGFTSNYQTARVTEFHTADQGELFERMWAQPMRVDIGYIEDETGTAVADVKVARRRTPREIDWTFTMTETAAETPLPIVAEAPASPERHTEIGARAPKAAPQELQGTDDA